ncbi:MAG TPA: glucosaminidase domain-containing protein [Burkholderiaceae bacterium]|nr:glucosaminidase domain-containing protein [Burkholderiaceae bacterium]
MRPDAIRSPSAEWPALHAPAATGGGNGFGALYAEVQREVRAFIDHGDDRSMPTAARMQQPAPDAASAPDIAAADVPIGPEQRAFLARIGPSLEQAARTLGVAPQVLAAQAALETGWGRYPMRAPDGSPMWNLFGVKAGPGWTGASAPVATTEVMQGQVRHEEAAFRAYADVQSGVDDFARLISQSPRYRAALHTGNDSRAYAEALAQGGYATDPQYADKLVRVARQLQRGR